MKKQIDSFLLATIRLVNDYKKVKNFKMAEQIKKTGKSYLDYLETVEHVVAPSDLRELSTKTKKKKKREVTTVKYDDRYLY